MSSHFGAVVSACMERMLCEPSGIPRNDFGNWKRVSRTSLVDSLLRWSFDICVASRDRDAYRINARCTTICVKALLEKKKKRILKEILKSHDTPG